MLEGDWRCAKLSFVDDVKPVLKYININIYII